MKLSNLFKMNSITINGESFVVNGKNIKCKNNKVYVDGELIKEGLSGDVKIHFNGDLASLTCADAVVTGNVQGDVNAADLQCGNIGGRVNCADLKCTGDIKGNVSAADVKCNNIAGSVTAAEVKYRK
jgi:hypothetical protein